MEEDVRDWVSDWSEPVGSLLSPKSKVSHCQIISCTRSTSALPTPHGQAFRMSVSEATLEHLWSNVVNSPPILSFVSALRQLLRLRTSPWPDLRLQIFRGRVRSCGARIGKCSHFRCLHLFAHSVDFGAPNSHRQAKMDGGDVRDSSIGHIRGDECQRGIKPMKLGS